MSVYYFGLSVIGLFFLGIVRYLTRSKENTVGSRLYLVGLISLVSVSSGVGYYFFGAFKPLQSLYAYRDIHVLLSSLQKTPNLAPEQVEQNLSNLYQTLPQTEYIHAKLGEIYLALNLYDKAEGAYQKALKIQKDNRDYLYGYYYAQSLVHHGILPERSRSVLATLLDSYPKDNGFLNLVAVHYFQSNQYENAVKYWERIRSDNAEEAYLIRSMIERANAQLERVTLPSPRIKLTIKWDYPNIRIYPVVFLVVKYPDEAMPVLVKKLEVDRDIIPGEEQSYLLSNQDVMGSNQRFIAKGQKVSISVRGAMSGIANKSSQDKVVASPVLLLDAEQIETKIIF